MKSDNMDSDLVEEIEYMIDLLSKSGFFDVEEIVEILEDQFIEEEIDFSKLDNAFKKLSSEGIVSIHNCGYDISEGVTDAFELRVHLLNNKFDPKGFCFYTFEDVEDSIFDENLKITFGDFENDEDDALAIGKIVSRCLKDENFNVVWDETVNNQIEINPFKWDKSYDDEKEYEIEGAYDAFVASQVSE